jgi:RNA polymerase sigma-70 factor, ECF subfamily
MMSGELSGRDQVPDLECLLTVDKLSAVDRNGEFRAAVETLSATVWRVLRRCGVPAADVEDAVQHVFIQLDQRWQRLRLLPAGELKAYACSVSTGVAKDFGRRRTRQLARTRQLDHEPADTTPPADEQLERLGQLRILDQLLLKLPHKRRAVFVLYELEQLTVQQIAAHLQLSPGTVASRLRVARQEFQRAAAAHPRDP